MSSTPPHITVYLPEPRIRAAREFAARSGYPSLSSWVRTLIDGAIGSPIARRDMEEPISLFLPFDNPTSNTVIPRE